MNIIDIHQHIGYHGSGFMREMAEDCEKRLEMMKDCGIVCAVVMPSPDYYMPNGLADTRKINDMMAGYRKQQPGKFPVALGTVEPRHGTASLEEIARLGRELKLDGIMWHHRFQGTHINHEMTKLYLTKITEWKLHFPVFIHNYSGSNLEAPWRLEVLAQAFPSLTFVSLSSLSSPENINLMLQAAKRQGNILLETGMLFPQQHLIARIVREIGSHRLLFGSDTYSDHTATDPQGIIELIMKAKISDEDRVNILERNARNLFTSMNIAIGHFGLASTGGEL